MKKGVGLEILGGQTVLLLVAVVLILVFAFFWEALAGLIPGKEKSIDQPSSVYNQLKEDIIDSKEGEHLYTYNALAEGFFIIVKDNKVCLCKDKECKKESKCQEIKSAQIKSVMIEGKGTGLNINIKRQGNIVEIEEIINN